MNQNHFSILLLVVAATLGYFAEQITGTNLQIVATKLINVALFTGITLGFTYFLRGTKYDVIKEIFEEHNIAGALFVGFFMCAAAICLTVLS